MTRERTDSAAVMLSRIEVSDGIHDGVWEIFGYGLPSVDDVFLGPSRTAEGEQVFVVKSRVANARYVRPMLRQVDTDNYSTAATQDTTP